MNIVKTKIFNILIVLFLVGGANIFAQDFEVAPINLDFMAEPGQTQNIPVTITNHANTPSAFTIHLSDFSVNKEGQTIYLPQASTEHTLVNWLSVNPPFIELNPNEKRQIIISIQAPVGDYSTRWATVFIRSTEEQTAQLVDKATQTALNVKGQIALTAIQSPRSNINYKLKIHSLSEITTMNDSIRSFSAIVDNLGDKIADCHITLLASSLADASETILDRIKLKSYPDSPRNIILKIREKLPPGKYALAAILDYGSHSNLEGTQKLIEVE